MWGMKIARVLADEIGPVVGVRSIGRQSVLADEKRFLYEVKQESVGVIGIQWTKTFLVDRAVFQDLSIRASTRPETSGSERALDC